MKYELSEQNIKLIVALRTKIYDYLKNNIDEDKKQKAQKSFQDYKKMFRSSSN